MKYDKLTTNPERISYILRAEQYEEISYTAIFNIRSLLVNWKTFIFHYCIVETTINTEQFY